MKNQKQSKKIWTFSSPYPQSKTPKEEIKKMEVG